MSLQLKKQNVTVMGSTCQPSSTVLCTHPIPLIRVVSLQFVWQPPGCGPAHHYHINILNSISMCVHPNNPLTSLPSMFLFIVLKISLRQLNFTKILMVIGYAMFTILFFIFELTINMRKFLPKF